MAVEMGKLLGDETQRKVFDYLAGMKKPSSVKKLQENLLGKSVSKTATSYGNIARALNALEYKGLVKSNVLYNAPDENGTSTAEITQYGLTIHKLLEGTSEIIRFASEKMRVT